MNNIKLLKDKELTKKFIEANHYSHKIPQAIKYRFGFYHNNELKGIVIFSIPANQYSITSIFNNETQFIGIELSRVYTYDNLPKNFLSYCLAQSFDYLKNNSSYDIIISYADPNFNHYGYIYQALNGTYLGQTTSEIRYLYNGQLITRRGLGRKKNDSEKLHSQRLLKAGAKKIKMKGKHKYLWFICNKKRKKDLLKRMKLVPLKYPKEND